MMLPAWPDLEGELVISAEDNKDCSTGFVTYFHFCACILSLYVWEQ